MLINFLSFNISLYKNLCNRQFLDFLDLNSDFKCRQEIILKFPRYGKIRLIGGTKAFITSLLLISWARPKTWLQSTAQWQSRGRSLLFCAGLQESPRVAALTVRDVSQQEQATSIFSPHPEQSKLCHVFTVPPPTALSPSAQGQKNHSFCPVSCQRLIAGRELLKTQLK